MKINHDIFKNKTVLVTGGTGSIGSEIVRELLAHDVRQVRVYSRGEFAQYQLMNELGGDQRLRFLLGDIRDKQRMANAFQGVNICFHAAALKHVPICEYNPYEAVKTNVVGSQNVIDLAIEHNLEKVVAISTDKAVDPYSVMGASKLMMEKLIVAARYITGDSETKFSVVRFGNVLHSRGSVIPLWKEQLAKGGPLTITDERMTRYIMEIPEAVNLIFKAAEMMRGGEIFVLKMPKVKVTELAQRFTAEHAPGREVPIKVVGIRPGEKLYEKLLTEEEAHNAHETDEMFILLPESLVGFSPDLLAEFNYRKVEGLTEYRSDR